MLDKNIKIDFRFWINNANGKNILGAGKIRLLENIDKHSSISAAAKEMNMSYRKAWGDIKNIENSLGFEITSKQRGGKYGGGTSLSDKGKKLVRLFNEIQSELDKNINNTFLKFKDEICD